MPCPVFLEITGRILYKCNMVKSKRDFQTAMTPDSPVFGLGLQKTGTTTLGVALERLGYKVRGQGFSLDMRLDRDKVLKRLDDLKGDYNAFQDYPWFLFYEDLDAAYPDAKFILTHRDPQGWIRSCQRYHQSYDRPTILNVYGVDRVTGNEDDMLKAFENHNARVREYFEDRPGKLLSVDFSREKDWSRLCDFLGIDIEDRPDGPLPLANKTSSVSSFFQRHAVGLTKQAAFSLQRRLDFSL